MNRTRNNTHIHTQLITHVYIDRLRCRIIKLNVQLNRSDSHVFFKVMCQELNVPDVTFQLKGNRVRES